MGISPLGYQNHIQNPLAAVMYAVMNGAFDNAKDARRTDYQLGQDRQQQDNRELDRALQIALQGGRGTSQPFVGRPGYEVVRAAEGVGSARVQDDAEARANRKRALDLQEQEINRRPQRGGDGFGFLGDIWDSVVGTGSQPAAVKKPAPRYVQGNDTSPAVMIDEDGNAFQVDPRSLPVYGAPKTAVAPPAGIPGAHAGAATQTGDDDPILRKLEALRGRFLSNGVVPVAP